MTCVAVEAGGRIVAGTRSPAYASSDGDRFVAIGTTYRDETGVVNEARHFSAMVRGPSGRVFAATRGRGVAGVLVLDDRKLRWRGKNDGLLYAPGEGMRSDVEITSLAIDGNGTGWVATARHGTFRRAQLDSGSNWRNRATIDS